MIDNILETSRIEFQKFTILSQRNHLLTLSDWTQMPDGPLNEEKKTAWAVYRQQLRDISLQPGFPDTFTWPERP
jgi:hypothetical protein